jgi:cation diffusion facilitator family transporter
MQAKNKSLFFYGWLSFGAAVVTIVLKSYAYWLTNSVGLLSDALETLINLVAALIVLMVLRIAAKPADDDHAYGHEKIEYFSSGAEGIMILLAAASIIVTALERLEHPAALQALDLGLAISLLTVLINGVVAWLLIKAGRVHRSLAVEADGRHLLTDVWTTLAIIVGIAIIKIGDYWPEVKQWTAQLGWTNWDYIDPAIAFLVAINIIWAGLALIKRTFAGLMDAALPQHELAEIVAILDAFMESERIAYHAMRTRYSGSRRFLSVHILVPGEWTVQQGHDLLEQIERTIQQRFEDIDIDTHLEPIEDSASWTH